MLESIIITDQEMAALPDGIAGFLEYEGLCRAKLNSTISRADPNDDTMDIRVSYLTNVINAAVHYDVTSLKWMEFEPGDSFDYSKARAIARQIDSEVSKMRFVAMGERRPVLVIEEPQRAKVEHLIGQLRDRVRDSDLDERKKAKLAKKLDELAGLFAGKSQPTLKDTMIVIASIFTAINQGEAAIIKLPETISAVLEVFGHAQEDANEKLLEAKVAQLRIEHQKGEDEPTPPGPRETYDLNDDIPF